jgi:pimeloyl-ACP methyl ester carboxylesterase
MPYVKSNGIEVHYEIHGSGPAILLIHGLGNDAREWVPMTQHLKDRRTLISFDMRGSGRSDKPDGPYSMEEMAADAAGLLAEVAKPPVDVLGFSMGGCVAMQLALDRPDLVRELVLVSTLPSWHGPYPPCEALNKLFHRTDVCEELLSEVYKEIFGAEYRRRISSKEYVSQRMNDEFPQPVEGYLGQLAALEKFDVRERVGSISAETLVVAGTDDRVVPIENSSWLAERIPNARLEIVEGAGHMIPIERPDGLASIILEK